MPRLDHGVIGNGRVLALVAPDTGIEWLCLPRFDSPSLFGALLDAERGGVFRFLAGGQRVVGRAGYLPNTNVLRTELELGDARLEVIDFAPASGWPAAGSTRRTRWCAWCGRSRARRESPSSSSRGRTTAARRGGRS